MSYSWQTARLLGAELHDIATGGMALEDGTGYFYAPDYIGMLSSWDKINYYPPFGAKTDWDFSRYTPHVVVTAIGQNDANPVNFMAQNYEALAERLRGVDSRDSGEVSARANHSDDDDSGA